MRTKLSWFPIRGRIEGSNLVNVLHLLSDTPTTDVQYHTPCQGPWSMMAWRATRPESSAITTIKDTGNFFTLFKKHGSLATYRVNVNHILFP